jgi:hypothetical protein
MRFLECDLEEIIFLTEKEKIQERGLNVNGKLFRQKRIGEYGVSDLIEVNRPKMDVSFGEIFKGSVNVIELKKDKINVSSFLQAINYLKGIQTYLEEREMFDFFDYKITLIGSEIDSYSSFVYLTDIISDKSESMGLIGEGPTFVLDCYTYRYDVDGISFKKEEYYNLKNKGF